MVRPAAPCLNGTLRRPAPVVNLLLTKENNLAASGPGGTFTLKLTEMKKLTDLTSVAVGDVLLRFDTTAGVFRSATVTRVAGGIITVQGGRYLFDYTLEGLPLSPPLGQQTLWQAPPAPFVDVPRPVSPAAAGRIIAAAIASTLIGSNPGDRVYTEHGPGRVQAIINEDTEPQYLIYYDNEKPGLAGGIYTAAGKVVSKEGGPQSAVRIPATDKHFVHWLSAAKPDILEVFDAVRGWLVGTFDPLTALKGQPVNFVDNGFWFNFCPESIRETVAQALPGLSIAFKINPDSGKVVLSAEQDPETLNFRTIGKVLPGMSSSVIEAIQLCILAYNPDYQGYTYELEADLESVYDRSELPGVDSCMAGNGYYYRNLENLSAGSCRALVIYGENQEIHARALVWEWVTPDGRPVAYLDRQYGTSTFTKALIINAFYRHICAGSEKYVWMFTPWHKVWHIRTGAVCTLQDFQALCPPVLEFPTAHDYMPYLDTLDQGVMKEPGTCQLFFYHENASFTFGLTSGRWTQQGGYSDDNDPDSGLDYWPEMVYVDYRQGYYLRTLCYFNHVTRQYILSDDISD